MDKKFSKGGLIKKAERNDWVPVLLLPGESYVSKALFEKYGREFFQKLSGVEKIIVIENEKNA